MEIQTFDSFEEMQAAMDAAHTRAMAEFNQVPQVIRDYFAPGVKAVSAFQEGGEVFVVFHEIVESEYEEDRALMAREPWLRLVNSRSVLCPEGELGTVWVHMLRPISDELFALAETMGWGIPLEIVQIDQSLKARQIVMDAVRSGKPLS